jgi:hypothetical protein
LKFRDWQTIKVRDTAKGVLKGDYHFKTVFIWNIAQNEIEKRLNGN